MCCPFLCTQHLSVEGDGGGDSPLQQGEHVGAGVAGGAGVEPHHAVLLADRRRDRPARDHHHQLLLHLAHIAALHLTNTILSFSLSMSHLLWVCQPHPGGEIRQGERDEGTGESPEDNEDCNSDKGQYVFIN